jgi:hypothetical protein
MTTVRLKYRRGVEMSMMVNSVGENPTISVVTACYNDIKFLPASFKSIKNQTYKNIEHVVIDGNSTDGTTEFLSNWEEDINSDSDTIEFKWISEPDDGLYEAIEKGFNLATGDIYAWLNADDRWYSWTADIVSDIFKHTSYEWIVGHRTGLDNQGRPIHVDGLRRQFKQDWIVKGWYYNNALGCIQQESTFWTRKLWERAGGFPDEIELAGDYWLWRQFARETELRTVDTVLGGFRNREDGNQLSANQSKYLSEVDRSQVAELLGTLQTDRVYSILKNIFSEPISKKLKRSETIPD